MFTLIQVGRKERLDPAKYTEVAQAVDARTVFAKPFSVDTDTDKLRSFFEEKGKVSVLLEI